MQPIPWTKCPIGALVGAHSLWALYNTFFNNISKSGDGEFSMTIFGYSCFLGLFSCFQHKSIKKLSIHNENHFINGCHAQRFELGLKFVFRKLQASNSFEVMVVNSLILVLTPWRNTLWTLPIFPILLYLYYVHLLPFANIQYAKHEF